MADWADWIPNVASDVPNCPEPIIELAVKETVTDFLASTHWLQRTPAPVDIAAGAIPRSFLSPTINIGECVLAVLKAWIADKEVGVRGPTDVEDEWPDWKTRTGTPEFLVLERIDTYFIVPAPTALQSGALRLKVAIGLLGSATACDDLIRAHWRDEIASGAKARLLLQNDKPWSEPSRAAVHQARFDQGVSGAIIQAIRTPARRPLITPPYWF